MEIILEMREQSITNHVEEHLENDHKEPGIIQLRRHFRNSLIIGMC